MAGLSASVRRKTDALDAAGNTTAAIGSHVLLGPRVCLYTAGHPTTPEVRDTGLEFGLPITIGDSVWILSLAGIESESVFVNLLKPENFSPVIALIGIILIMGSKKQKRRDIGRIMVGFAILMYGMELMKNAVSPLADMPEFSSLPLPVNNDHE